MKYKDVFGNEALSSALDLAPCEGGLGRYLVQRRELLRLGRSGRKKQIPFQSILSLIGRSSRQKLNKERLELIDIINQMA